MSGENKRAKIRSNMPSVQSRLAKIYALNSLNEAVRQCVKTGFDLTETVDIVRAAYFQSGSELKQEKEVCSKCGK